MEWVTVMESYNIHEVLHMKAVLERYEITCVLLNEYSGQLLMGPAMGTVKLRVPAASEEVARMVVASNLLSEEEETEE